MITFKTTLELKTSRDWSLLQNVKKQGAVFGNGIASYFMKFNPYIWLATSGVKRSLHNVITLQLYYNGIAV